MVPTADQVARAAYHRWQSRGREHGRDREDWYAAHRTLFFELNYRAFAFYPLRAADRLILESESGPVCRFCERTGPHAEFTRPRPVVIGIGTTSLYTDAVCDECHSACREPLVGDLHRLLEAIWAETGAPEVNRGARPRAVCSLAAFKALVSSALLVMPESELAYFTDTLEWAGNPDPDCDANLFAGLFCRAYSAPFLREQASVCLVRRVDHEAALPYLVFFLTWGGVTIQVPLPLCLRDQDLDGRAATLPERVFRHGEGPSFREARSTVLPVVATARPARAALRPALRSR